MSTWKEQVEEIRRDWKQQAEKLAAKLADDQLEQVHRELVQISNSVGHAFEDVLIYINAVRAEYGKRHKGQP